MIAACVLMGAYVAEKGWSFASGGFYLLGVANGVFFASLNIGGYSPMTLARGILVLIPAFFAIGMSNYFRPWLNGYPFQQVFHSSFYISEFYLENLTFMMLMK